MKKIGAFIFLVLSSGAFAKDFVVKVQESVPVEVNRVNQVWPIKSRFDTELRLVQVFIEGSTGLSKLYLVSADLEHRTQVWTLPSLVTGVVAVHTENDANEKLITQVILETKQAKSIIDGKALREQPVKYRIFLAETEQVPTINGRVVEMDKKIPWPADELKVTLE